MIPKQYYFVFLVDIYPFAIARKSLRVKVLFHEYEYEYRKIYSSTSTSTRSCRVLFHTYKFRGQLIIRRN